tara:strand:+ start:243 stop:1556 length:1314 start_codon:yes stop_codon:yes gene_type:complete
MSKNNPLSLLATNPRFRQLWVIGLFTSIARWLDMLVVGIFAYELTHSPFFVALLVLLRLLPLIIVGPIIGTLSDRLNPKNLFGFSLCCAVVSSLTIYILFLLDIATYWHIAISVIVSGSVWATDFPLRRRMLGDSAQLSDDVDMEKKKTNSENLEVGNKKREKNNNNIAIAMSLDSASNNATRMIGPLTGGLTYYWLGPEGAFGIHFLLFLFSAVFFYFLPNTQLSSVQVAPLTKGVRELWEAIQYAASNRDLRSVLLITIVFNIWGFPFLSMIPVIGGSELGLNASWIGLIVAMEGLGAFIGALIVAMKVKTKYFRILFFYSSALHLILIFILGWIDEVIPFGLIVLLIGLVAAGFTTMQSTLIFTVSKPEMRGRLFGLVVACIGTGLIGNANIGLMGELFGGSKAISITALEGIVPLIIIGFLWKELRKPITKIN